MNAIRSKVAFNNAAADPIEKAAQALRDAYVSKPVDMAKVKKAGNDFMHIFGMLAHAHSRDELARTADHLGPVIQAAHAYVGDNEADQWRRISRLADSLSRQPGDAEIFRWASPSSETGNVLRLIAEEPGISQTQMIADSGYPAKNLAGIVNDLESYGFVIQVRFKESVAFYLSKPTTERLQDMGVIGKQHRAFHSPRC